MAWVLASYLNSTVSSICSHIVRFPNKSIHSLTPGFSASRLGPPNFRSAESSAGRHSVRRSLLGAVKPSHLVSPSFICVRPNVTVEPILRPKTSLSPYPSVMIDFVPPRSGNLLVGRPFREVRGAYHCVNARSMQIWGEGLATPLLGIRGQMILSRSWKPYSGASAIV